MTYSIEIPESARLSETDMKMILAGELYERGILTIGQSAMVAGLSKRTFLELMGKYGFSLFQQNEEELLKEIGNA
ncbi:MAG: UPF0175 family protein [Bacteroidia bacterium]|nr:UPF0175 family protein [Bacteroidia bacterium]